LPFPPLKRKPNVPYYDAAINWSTGFGYASNASRDLLKNKENLQSLRIKKYREFMP
jgi:hypothetical protein